MVVESSVTGVFRTLLLLIGVFVVLRFLGRLMIAKRNLEAERNMLKKQREFEQEKQQLKRNFGKTNILSKTNNSKGSAYEDIEFETLDS
ncbi:MAG: hypothetical protein KJ941_00970 [Bacteroidetes bacterium]|nr:hypothetical protein [Bacteroidota bacterium]